MQGRLGNAGRLVSEAVTVLGNGVRYDKRPFYIERFADSTAMNHVVWYNDDIVYVDEGEFFEGVYLAYREV